MLLATSAFDPQVWAAPRFVTALATEVSATENHKRRRAEPIEMGRRRRTLVKQMCC